MLLDDPWLAPYKDVLDRRRRRPEEAVRHLTGGRATLAGFANGHRYFDLHDTAEGQVYREWAPSAHALYLVGDFNGWDRTSHPLERLEGGVWQVRMPRGTVPHRSRYKVHVVSRRGAEDRIPLYARRVVQDFETRGFAAEAWLPPEPFRWTDQGFSTDPEAPRLIYEAHVGMAQEREGLGTYDEFRERTLPRIAALGYDTIQLMAIQEHPYYGSFGYHVANFFAPCSRFGTPDELRRLIDAAHGLGIAVLLDVVHSHAVKNTLEGPNEFDGTVWQFFHDGPKGDHPVWDSKLFDYGQPGVAHFLLSNLKYWLEEFHFDGFRFDGVTSMLYEHHGLGTGFDHMDKYFVHGVDENGVTYLQLANMLVREVNPRAITIAEDVSGMPGIGRPVEEGGLGFDFRLAMGLPDYWFKLVKERRDEDWSMGELFHALTNRRLDERHVAYVESHDQSLVGDKTMMFTLADSAMYWHMGKDDGHPVVDRAVALHKMMRLATLAAGGEGYLTFMGNEFGHPDWVDFPREGNGWSYRHARRQWSLVDDPSLKYAALAAFDRAMIAATREVGALAADGPTALWTDEAGKVLAFARGRGVFVFNFHPTASHASFPVPVLEAGRYRILLDSDAREFGGHARVDATVRHEAVVEDETPTLRLYLPTRTALVLVREAP